MESGASQKEERTLPEGHLPVAELDVLLPTLIQLRLPEQKLTCFPIYHLHFYKKRLSKAVYISIHLEPTNPYPITVHTGTFPTSSLKAAIGVFATTTKICTTKKEHNGSILQLA